MDLNSMKYSDLQSLAKELGLKANVKAEKLRKAIQQHYEEKSQDQNQDQNQDQDQDPGASRFSFSPGFVNTRRGKVNGTKRKLSETGTDQGRPASTERSTEEAVSAAASGATRGKKRKVSSAKDTETVASGRRLKLQEQDQLQEQQLQEQEQQLQEEQLQEQQLQEQEQQLQEQQLQPEIIDEAAVSADAEVVSKVAKAGKIPRLQKKPCTPNFQKLHQANFNKMESIDSYLQRKTKKLETYRGSAKDSKCSEKMNPQEPKGQERANRASLLSPAPRTRAAPSRRAAEERRRHTVLSTNKAPPKKPTGKEDATFQPSVLSLQRINVRFTEATHDKDGKRSTVKTPARVSSYMSSSTPLRQAGDAGKPKAAVFSATKTPGPFVFSGNTSTVATPGTQKAKFDLKASLSRPLTYKPHAGKLKPFGDLKENAAANKSLVSVSSHQKNYKQHQAKTREDRRAKQAQDRKQKKEGVLGARRGLVMM